MQKNIKDYHYAIKPFDNDSILKIYQNLADNNVSLEYLPKIENNILINNVMSFNGKQRYNPKFIERIKGDRGEAFIQKGPMEMMRPVSLTNEEIIFFKQASLSLNMLKEGLENQNKRILFPQVRFYKAIKQTDFMFEKKQQNPNFKVNSLNVTKNLLTINNAIYTDNSLASMPALNNVQKLEKLQNINCSDWNMLINKTYFLIADKTSDIKVKKQMLDQNVNKINNDTTFMVMSLDILDKINNEPEFENKLAYKILNTEGMAANKSAVTSYLGIKNNKLDLQNKSIDMLSEAEAWPYQIPVIMSSLKNLINNSAFPQIKKNATKIANDIFNNRNYLCTEYSMPSGPITSQVKAKKANDNVKKVENIYSEMMIYKNDSKLIDSFKKEPKKR